MSSVPARSRNIPAPSHNQRVTPRTAPRFDHLAQPYRWLEYFSFGPLLQQTRTHWLPAIPHCRSALVLGDGDGRFTAALLALNPAIQIHAVDGSPAMLRLLAARCNSKERLHTELADLRHWTPPANHPFDLVVTHFFLDCLTTTEVATLARRIAPALTPHATWIVSDFAIPHTRFGQWIASPIVHALYLAFAILTGLGVRRLPDHASALESHGWRKQQEARRAGGLLLSQLWQLARTPMGTADDQRETT